MMMMQELLPRPPSKLLIPMGSQNLHLVGSASFGQNLKWVTSSSSLSTFYSPFTRKCSPALQSTHAFPDQDSILDKEFCHVSPTIRDRFNSELLELFMKDTLVVVVDAGVPRVVAPGDNVKPKSSLPEFGTFAAIVKNGNHVIDSVMGATPILGFSSSTKRDSQDTQELFAVLVGILQLSTRLNLDEGDTYFGSVLFFMDNQTNLQWLQDLKGNYEGERQRLSRSSPSLITTIKIAILMEAIKFTTLSFLKVSSSANIADSVLKYMKKLQKHEYVDMVKGFGVKPVKRMSLEELFSISFTKDMVKAAKVQNVRRGGRANPRFKGKSALTAERAALMAEKAEFEAEKASFEAYKKAGFSS